MTNTAGDETPILDTHQHLWNLERLRLPWLEGQQHLNRSFVMQDYLEAAAGLPVGRTVYMEVDVAPEQHVAEAEYVIELCERDDNPMAAAVIGGRPAERRFIGYIRRFRDCGYVKGVRQVLHGSAPRGACLEEDFVAGIQLLGEFGLSFDLCMRPDELGDAGRLVDACPGTRFILDHCGNPRVGEPDRTEWETQISALGARPNIVCKVSGIVPAADPGSWQAADLAPFVNHVIDAFGWDRVMFGGDWPVCTRTATLRDWILALQTIVTEHPEPLRRKLFNDNAVRFYGLD